MVRVETLYEMASRLGRPLTAAEELGIPPTPAGHKHEVYKFTPRPAEPLEAKVARLERELANARGASYRGPIMGADPGYSSGQGQPGSDFGTGFLLGSLLGS